MKRFISITLVALILFSACQKQSPDNSIINEVSTTTAVTKASVDVSARTIDEPYVFLAEKDSDTWRKLDSEQRMATCKVPMEIVKRMTTEALIKTVLHFPLNYNILFADDPLEAIKIIVSHSTIHQELIGRDDALQLMISFFAKSYIDMNICEGTYNSDYEALCYSDEIFFEYFLASDFFVLESLSLEKKSEFENALRIKARRRTSNTESFGSIEIMSLSAICDRYSFDLGIMSSQSSQDETIYTPFRQSLIGYSSSETFSRRDINAYAQAIYANFSGVTILADADPRYNCHSYAWYSQNTTTNHIWLEQHHNGAFQLSKYWNADLYIECDENEASHIYYPDGDGGHSAKNSGNGYYTSKWGPGPLVKHLPNQVPEIYGTPKVYFKTRTTPILVSGSVEGSGQTLVNQPTYYRPALIIPDGTFSWSVDPIHTQDASSYSLTTDGNACYFTAYQPGAYYLYMTGYCNNNEVVNGYIIITAWPQ